MRARGQVRPMRWASWRALESAVRSNVRAVTNICESASVITRRNDCPDLAALQERQLTSVRQIAAMRGRVSTGSVPSSPGSARPYPRRVLQ
jgi:hypothetical protein